MPDPTLLLPQVPPNVAEATHAYLVAQTTQPGGGDEWEAVVSFYDKVVFAGLEAAFLDAWVQAARTARAAPPENATAATPATSRRRRRLSARTSRDKDLLAAVTAARKYVAACDGDGELAACAIHAGLTMDEVWEAKGKGSLDLASLKTLARLRI